MHKLTFHNLGNADCTRVDLHNGRKILIDYANKRSANDPSDKRVDLPQALRLDLRLTHRNYYDVVVFTHLDDDHIHGAPDFFYLEHASCYQSDDRIHIRELWVPAAAIIETGSTHDARVIRQEARHRLKMGSGIRVFSSPGLLDSWLRDNGINPEDRRGLIQDAGQVVPGFSLAADGVEFFAHSPFATRQTGELLNRNKKSIAFQATFLDSGRLTRALFFADVTYDVIADIVGVTEFHGRYERLRWNVIKVAHHSSYTALGPEKGTKKTVPDSQIKRLLEGADPRGNTYGNAEGSGAIIISTSDRIPSFDTTLPPHRQAAAYYRDAAGVHSGAFKVTMEHPSVSLPHPLVVKIDGFGASVEKNITGGFGPIAAQAPRAGHR